MKFSRMVTVLAALVLVHGHATAVDYQVKVERVSDTDRERVDAHPKYGDGDVRHRQVYYDVSINTWGKDPTDITLKLYGYSQAICDADQIELKNYQEVKTQLKPPQETRLKMGPFSYSYGDSKFVSSRKTGSCASCPTITTVKEWEFGSKEYAYLLEVYEKGQLVQVVSNKKSNRFKEVFLKTRAQAASLKETTPVKEPKSEEGFTPPQPVAQVK